MYKGLIRPVLFLTTLKRCIIWWCSWLKHLLPSRGSKKLLRTCLIYNHPVLKTSVAGLDFENRVGMVRI